MKKVPVITTLITMCLLAALTGAARASSPSGTNSRLAFAIKDGSGISNIYSVKPNGNGLIRLTNSTAFDLCPDYSRDGRLITFCSNHSGSFQIWSMNADVRAPRTAGRRRTWLSGCQLPSRVEPRAQPAA